MKHVNIPIFIPHLGCPNQCVFCNQRTISGVTDFDLNSVDSIIKSTLNTIEHDSEVEIAFFGGSFTGIERTLMIDLLTVAKKYIDAGAVKSIRCSTRPDYIDDEILTILKNHGVKTIELGLQSISDDVLLTTKRGHNFEAEKNAVKLILSRGFDLVGQMMIGLPGATAEDEINTADFIVSSGAISARIYPTVVFKETELCCMAEEGLYSPLTTEDAISRSAAVLSKFVHAGIKVIRIGLCASENLNSDTTYFAGPNHPALGELVVNQYYLCEIKKCLAGMSTTGKSLIIYAPKGSLSKVVGQKKRNKILLSEEFPDVRFAFKESARLSEYQIQIAEER